MTSEVKCDICKNNPKSHPLPSGIKSLSKTGVQESKESSQWRRQCGCIRTSDKLRNILNTFPAPPPPSPAPLCAVAQSAIDKTTCGYCYSSALAEKSYLQSADKYDCASKKCNSKSWQVVGEVVQLVQLSVTATALALYYLIYCYMQLVYYTLRSALYFHNADGPMKITIGVVTVTSLVVGFNLMLRMERILGILY